MRRGGSLTARDHPFDTRLGQLLLVGAMVFASTASNCAQGWAELPDSVSWVPTCLVVAALHRRRPGLMPWGLSGAALGVLGTVGVSPHPPWATLVMALGCVGEATVTLLLLRRFVPNLVWTGRDLIRGLALGVGVGPLLPALGAAGVAAAAGRDPFAAALLIYIFNAAALALVLPATWLLLEVSPRDDAPLAPSILLWVATIIGLPVLLHEGSQPLLFYPLVPLIWFALLGLARQAVLAMLVVATISVVCTQLGLGPLAAVEGGGPYLRPLLSAFYLTALEITVLPTAWLFVLHSRARVSLAESERRAMRANEAKSDFLATVSHELRTPLAGMVGHTQMLRRTPLNEQQARLLERVETGAEQLRQVIGDVLDLERVASRELEPQRTVVALEGLARSILELVEGQLPQSVEARLEVEAEVPEHVEVDATWLRQILLNLLNNAAKFTAEGHIVLHLQVLDDGVRFEVRDTGPGIPEEELVHVFQRFTKVGAGRGGAGLGLSIVRRLCEAMHGRVSVSSELGVGSVFQVWLPLRAVEALASSEPPPIEGAAIKEAIEVLLVDDDPVMTELMSLLLDRYGCQVSAVSDAEQALALLEARPFELLLTDLNLGGVDGLELARRALALQPSLRLALMTADATLEVQERALAAGLETVLVKPVPQAALRALLGRVPRPSASEVG